MSKLKLNQLIFLLLPPDPMPAFRFADFKVVYNQSSSLKEHGCIIRTPEATIKITKRLRCFLFVKSNAIFKLCQKAELIDFISSIQNRLEDYVKPCLLVADM